MPDQTVAFGSWRRISRRCTSKTGNPALKGVTTSIRAALGHKYQRTMLPTRVGEKLQYPHDPVGEGWQLVLPQQHR
jgi:hypothetical protein